MTEVKDVNASGIYASSEEDWKKREGLMRIFFSDRSSSLSAAPFSITSVGSSPNRHATAGTLTESCVLLDTIFSVTILGTSWRPKTASWPLRATSKHWILESGQKTQSSSDCSRSQTDISMA